MSTGCCDSCGAFVHEDHIGLCFTCTKMDKVMDAIIAKQPSMLPPKEPKMVIDRHGQIHTSRRTEPMYCKKHYVDMADAICRIEQGLLDKAIHVALHEELMGLIVSQIALAFSVDNKRFDSMIFDDAARRKRADIHGRSRTCDELKVIIGGSGKSDVVQTKDHHHDSRNNQKADQHTGAKRRQPRRLGSTVGGNKG